MLVETQASRVFVSLLACRSLGSLVGWSFGLSLSLGSSALHTNM